LEFVRWVWGLLWPARATFVELEHLQGRLLRSLLYLAVSLTLILLLLDAWSPGYPGGPLFAFSLLLGLGLLVLVLRPASQRWVLRGLLAVSIGAIAWAALSWGSAVAPSVHCLVVFGLVGTMVDSPITGNWITAAGLALMLVLRQRFGLSGPPAEMLWFNVCSCLLLAQGISLAFYHVFVGVQTQLNDQAQRLAQADSERRRLAGALFEGLQAPVQGLARAAQRPLAEGGAQLRDQVRAVADQLQGAASLRQDQGWVDVAIQAEAGLNGVRQRFMTAILWAAFAAVLAAAVHNFFQREPLARPLGLALLLGAALLGLGRRRLNTGAVNAVQLALYLGLFGQGLWLDGLRGVPPTLPYLPVIVLAAGLLLGFRWALLVAGVGTGLLLWIWSFGAPGFVESASLGDILLALALLTAVCREVWSLHAQLLQQLQQRAQALTESLRQRRRLLGALFHDINNPLMAIQSILQLPQVGVPLEPQDQQRVQNMAARIQQLVGAAATFYLVDTDVPRESLVPVDVPRLFADTQELFEERLQIKQQRLSVSVPPALAVLSLPEVLRDSVLSNLVSNALKFSPPKAGLVLETRLRPDEVGLVVRDMGSGVPFDVLDSLARGLAVSSRPGTGGEQGQGLGLGLVQEHLRRLGGRLELERLAGGGTEARVWLKRA
jgi:signal transduction histidine kinase